MLAASPRYVQNISPFLDVDNLDDTARLEEHVGNSEAVIVLLTGSTAVADVVLQALTEAGMKVAIVSRTQSKLDATATKYNTKLGEGTVKGFSFDLSNVAGVKDLMATIATDMGAPIKVIYYNAAQFSLPYDAPAEEVIAANNVNFGTLWCTFGTMLESARRRRVPSRTYAARP